MFDLHVSSLVVLRSVLLLMSYGCEARWRIRTGCRCCPLSWPARLKKKSRGRIV